MIETKLYKISDIKPNPNNPRIIKDDKFLKLVNSIKEFPEMLKIRPIVINEDNIVLGGNMRLKACKEAKLKEIPVIMASELTEAQQREFIIKDNIGFGEWDFQDLAQNWNAEELETWGLDLPTFASEVDYSILDEDDISSQLESMTNGVKKAIQIEFESEHYEEAYELIKFWREREAYVGGMIMEFLKKEKETL